jgi:hypothetical protein
MIARMITRREKNYQIFAEMKAQEIITAMVSTEFIIQSMQLICNKISV